MKLFCENGYNPSVNKYYIFAVVIKGNVRLFAERKRLLLKNCRFEKTDLCLPQKNTEPTKKLRQINYRFRYDGWQLRVKKE